MVQINFAQKQVNAKIVYYGPGMSGKTTNLEIVHQRAPEQNKGDLTSISTDGDRTLFFDFMPLDLGTVAGMRTCFQIYTVPGQVYYNSTRKLVLQGVDGVVFVADSSAAMKEENFESLRNLEENLNEYGKSLATLPHVIQFNKRDLPDALPVEELNSLFNQHNAPSYEAIAKTGQGVFPTLKALAARVLESIHQNSNGAPARQAPANPPRPNQTPQNAPAAQRAPGAPLPRVAQEGQANPQRPMAVAGAQAQGGLGLGPRTSLPPPPAAPQMPAPAQAYGAPPQPAMNQAGLLTQTGFHNSALGAPPQGGGQGGAQVQNQGQGQGQGLNLTSRAAAAGSAPRAPGKPKPAAQRPAPAAGGKPLESTRFRPRNATPAPRSAPRATPTTGAGGKGMSWALVGVGLVVVGVLGWVAASFL
jgi:signal recognition particle receptor subunit beta